MRSSTLGFVLSAGALAVVLSACGGGGGGSTLPPTAIGAATNASSQGAKGGATAAPAITANVTTSALARVQQFSYATATSAGETASTVTLGTSGSAGIAPAPGDLLVALISLDDTGGGPVVSAPGGWGQIAGSAVNISWVHQVVETLAVGATPPPSVTFSYNERVGALITIVDVANAAGIDVVTAASKSVANPWTTSSGTGSQGGSADLDLAMFSINDSILTPSALGGYTTLTAAGRHGDGNTNYGHSVGVYAANAPSAAGAVAAQSISWANGSGTESVIGEQIVLKAVPPPTPAPTPLPTPVPTPVPTMAAGCGTTPALVNGVEYVAGWTPYGCSSVWNQHVSANPTYAAFSNAVIASEFGTGNTQPVRDQEAGPYDYGHPIYYASPTDPLVTLQCTAYCNRTDNGGYPASIHIPVLARPAGGSDAHMAVIQPDGTEIDMWATATPSGNWTNGATLTAHAIANCGSFTSGSGVTPTGPAATAGGACLGAGLLRANELASGAIDHALFLITQCANGWQYPAFPNASTNACTSGTGPALGARLWYDVPDATTNANVHLAAWEKAVLNALHDYGGYLEDNISGGAYASGIAFLAESGEASSVFGQTDPFAALAAQGWYGISISGASQTRWVGADPWQPSGVSFVSHLHWLDPCSARGSC